MEWWVLREVVDRLARKGMRSGKEVKWRLDGMRETKMRIRVVIVV